ncbi:unnamed protein product [Arctogadus glacialis]
MISTEKHSDKRKQGPGSVYITTEGEAWGGTATHGDAERYTGFQEKQEWRPGEEETPTRTLYTNVLKSTRGRQAPSHDN